MSDYNINEIKDLLPYIFGQDESGYYHAEIPYSKLPYYFKRDMQLKRYTTVLVSVCNISPYTGEENPDIKDDTALFDIFVNDVQDDWGDGNVNFKIIIRGLGKATLATCNKYADATIIADSNMSKIISQAFRDMAPMICPICGKSAPRRDFKYVENPNYTESDDDDLEERGCL